MLLSDAKDTQRAGLRLPPASRPIRRAQFPSSSSARRQRPPPRCPWKRSLLSHNSRASFASQMPADCVFCDSVVADFPQGHHHAIALATFCEDALFRDGPHLSRQARKCRTRHKTQAKSRPTTRHRASTPEVGTTLLYWVVLGLCGYQPLLSHGPAASESWLPTVRLLAKVPVIFDDPLPGTLCRKSAGLPKEMEWKPVYTVSRTEADSPSPQRVSTSLLVEGLSEPP